MFNLIMREVQNKKLEINQKKNNEQISGKY